MFHNNGEICVYKEINLHSSIWMFYKLWDHAKFEQIEELDVVCRIFQGFLLQGNSGFSGHGYNVKKRLRLENKSDN